MFRVLIFGSRDLETGPPSPVWTILSGLAFPAIPDAPMEVVEGGCPTGADAAARAWLGNSPDADPEAISHRGFAADWHGPCGPHCPPGHRKRRGPEDRDYCPAAGVIRNQVMVEYLMEHGPPYQAWGVVTKPLRESRGSFDMATRLWRAGLPFQLVQVMPARQPPLNVSEAFAAYRGAAMSDRGRR